MDRTTSLDNAGFDPLVNLFTLPGEYNFCSSLEIENLAPPIFNFQLFLGGLVYFTSMRKGL